MTNTTERPSGPPGTQRARAWWAPGRLSWWTGALFAVGSTCFFVGPFPGFVEAVGSAVDATVFFVGSVFFTTAAALQCLETFNRRGAPGFRLLAFEPRSLDWWSSVVQFAGTLFFNVTTFEAMQVGLEDPSYDRLVWTPDARGSLCFLVAGYLAFRAAAHAASRPQRHDAQWQIASVNFVGCIAFGVSAAAAYVVPSTGSPLDLAAANLWTAFGGLCFLGGAILLLRADARAAPPSRDAHTTAGPRSYQA